MFVLTLNIDDPDDAAYFINKTLNKIHGYIQHEAVKLALFFTFKYIKVYSDKKETLLDLLENKAVCFDIKRNIFEAELSTVMDEKILVFKRIHNIIYDVNKKVKKRINYYVKTHYNKEENQNKNKANEDNQKKLSIQDQSELDEKEKELKVYYKNQRQQQKNEKYPYFIVKNEKHRFTLWIKVQEINVSDFPNMNFNSYGLIHL